MSTLMFIASANPYDARQQIGCGGLPLHDAGLIHRANAVQKSRFPLKHYSDRSCFKVYVHDVGLLGAMARTPTSAIVERYRLFEEYKGALAKNIVAQYSSLHHFPSQKYGSVQKIVLFKPITTMSQWSLSFDVDRVRKYARSFPVEAITSELSVRAHADRDLPWQQVSF